MPAVTPNAAFASRVVRMRKRKRLTQKQLAEAVGVSTKTVWRWEKLGDMPERVTMPKLAAVLGVDELWLEKGIDDEPSSSFEQPGLPEVAEYLRTHQVPGRIEPMLRHFPFAELRAVHPSDEELDLLRQKFEALPTQDLMDSYLQSERGADTPTELCDWLKSVVGSPPVSNWVRTVDDVHTVRKYVENRAWELVSSQTDRQPRLR